VTKKSGGGHKKSLSVFSQEHLPKSVFSAGSKNSRSKFDTGRPSQKKKKASAKIIAPAAVGPKKLISVKPSQMLPSDSNAMIEQFEQFR
jgi:hypothetical protein